MGNPAIWPLIYKCNCEDVVLVQINPIHNDKLPRSAGEIINRLNEISFNSSLISEMRAIDFVSKLLHSDAINPERYKDMKVHLIYSREHMEYLNASSKMNADWDFFMFLKGLGRQTADKWVKAHWDDIGKKSTINIHEKFLCGPGMHQSYGDMGERPKPSTKKIKPAVAATIKQAQKEVAKKPVTKPDMSEPVAKKTAKKAALKAKPKAASNKSAKAHKQQQAKKRK